MAKRAKSTEVKLSAEGYEITIDSGLFTAGFASGLIIGKMLLKSSWLILGFALGMGFAIGTKPKA